MKDHLDLFVYMYRSSGKDYNDFGRFKSCAKNDKFNYMLLNCKEERCANRFPIDVSTGLCISKQCNEVDMQILLPYWMGHLNEMMPY